MELRTHGLALDLIFGPSDEEGWMPCHAVVDVPGFHGEIDFPMLRTDLGLFRSQLADAVGTPERPSTARLVSTDPGLDLFLQVEKNGQVQGRYRFGLGSDDPELSGRFVMDQTFLRPLLVQVDQVLADLG